jgi:pimeloyl-ACP methyl ester carboxylesterase
MSTGRSSFSRIEQLEGDFRVISPSYPQAISLEATLDGLAGILDAEGIERAQVIGHSLGAGLAHAFVRRYPQRVDKLVLSGFGLYTPFRLQAIKLFLWLFKVLPFRFLQRYYMGRFKKRWQELMILSALHAGIRGRTAAGTSQQGEHSRTVEHAARSV